MEIINFRLIIFIGACIVNVVSFDPMLTYTIRYKKITTMPNITLVYTIDQYREMQLINAVFTIDTKEIIDRIVVYIERCDPDRINCEYFQSWEFKDVCKKLLEKNQIWSRWTESMHPPFVCPINKVKYQMINGTYDIRPMLELYPLVTDYEWRITKKFYAGDIFVGGYTMEMSIFGYRKKKTKQNQS